MVDEWEKPREAPTRGTTAQNTKHALSPKIVQTAASTHWHFPSLAVHFFNLEWRSLVFCDNRVCRQDDQTWLFRSCKENRQSTEDVVAWRCGERSVASVIVPSVSVKWMKNRNKCDTTEKCVPAHQWKACFHPSSELLLHTNTEKMAAQNTSF